MPPSDIAVNRAFALIERAALADDRAPQNAPYGPLHKEVLQVLFNQKMVRSEVYGGNWRRFTLLVGPHAGRSTQDCPGSARPYRVVNGLPGTRADGVAARPQPSKPRPLTREEIERL